MQKYFLGFIAFLLLNAPTILFAQQKNWQYYKPDSNNLAASHRFFIKINIHFCRNTDGTGNFTQAEGRKYAQRLIKEANYQLQHNQKMNLPIGNTTPALPTLYEYVLVGEKDNDDGIYFDDSTETNFFDPKNMANMGSEIQYNTFGRNKDKVINVFMIETTDTTHYNQSGIGYPNWAKVSDAYRNYKIGKDTWFVAGLLNHEIGHTLGLAHTWQGYDGCDDTPTNPNCWNTGAGKCATASNNMMDYNANQNALSPCQISAVRHNLSTDATTHQFLQRTWCNYRPDTAVYIRSNEVWQGIKFFDCDIIILPNATLTIKNKVLLPQGANIYVRRNAKIIIDAGGIITNDCNQRWDGIKVWGNKTKNYPQCVLIQNGGKLENYEE